MKRNKYCLFGIVPLLYREEYDDAVIWKLLKFIPVVTIKSEIAKKTIKVLGIPVIKDSERGYCSTWTYKLIRILASLPTKRNVVLITDNVREPNANIVDNFTLFEYLYNSDKKIFKPYYILEENSPYYKEIKNKYKGRILGFKSIPTIGFKLKLLWLMPHLKYACDSFNALDALQVNFNYAIKKSKHVISVFTQHGVNYFKPDFVRPNVFGFEMYDYTTAANDMEKEILVKRGTFPPNRVIHNGLFRWDNIKPCTPDEKSIFVFFTKRAYLKKLSRVDNCQYVKEINKILNNPNLQDVLLKNNIKLKVGIHHSAAEFIRSSVKNKNIILISEDDIGKVKQEASLLLTDYSSMCFEFFLQNKPVIFYNIDDSVDCKLYGGMEDMANPYEGKENELFNITKTSEEVCSLLVKYIENGFQCEKEVLDKEAKFFYYRDNFCKRFEDFMISNLNSKK